MAILRAKDAKSLSSEERRKKLTELKSELTKSHVAANKTNAKTREIKRAIARLLTYETLNKSKPQKATTEELKKK